MRSICTIAPLLVFLFSCSENADKVGIEKGEIAPGIITQDINENEFDLKELQGSFVLIDFWGSWCGPCIREAPQLVALYNEFSPKGLKIVSIAVEKNDNNWKKAADKLGYKWEHQLVEISQFVRFNKIASDYNVTDIPSIFLLDKDGRVIASKIHAEEARSLLSEKL